MALKLLRRLQLGVRVQVSDLGREAPAMEVKSRLRGHVDTPYRHTMLLMAEVDGGSKSLLKGFLLESPGTGFR